MPQPLSLHSVEGLSENFDVACAAGLFTCRFNPLFLQRVFRRAIGLVKHAEDAWERQLSEFVRGELVGHVVA